MPGKTIAEGANKRFFHDVRTTADPDAIWRLWTSPQTWKLWDQGLADAEFEGAFVVGATGRIIPNAGPKSRFEIIALDPGRSYAFKTRLPLARLVVERAFVSRAPTCLRHEVRFEGFLGGFWAERFGPGFREALPPTMEELVRLAEKQTPR